MFFDFLSTIRRGDVLSGAAALISPDGESGEKPRIIAEHYGFSQKIKKLNTHRVSPRGFGSPQMR